jgi:hypothetical protein
VSVGAQRLGQYEIAAPQIDLAGVPPPIMTSEPGSFARYSLEVRIPRILDDTLAANSFPQFIRRRLAELRQEIVAGQISSLVEPAPDASFWQAVSAAYIGHAWLDVPAYWAEAYFYRRLLEATGYFQPGDWHGVDPFANIKATEWAPEGAPRVVATLLRELPEEPEARFMALVRASLWGNRVDLSYRAVASLGVAHGGAAHGEDANLLVDDAGAAWQLLRSRSGGTVAMLNDNAGTELAMDLALADFLLESGLVSRVVLHLKPQPFFVSDAMPVDVTAALGELAGGGPPLEGLAARLLAWQEAGRLRLETHWFSATNLFYYQLPADLRAELAEARLVLVKGDANYRRLFGDAHWPPATPFAPAAAYFPAPLLALRTLKFEIVLGLRPGEAESLSAVDPDWRINGKRGVIQFSLPAAAGNAGPAREDHHERAALI